MAHMVSGTASEHKMPFYAADAQKWLGLLHGGAPGYINVVSTSDFRGTFHATSSDGIDAAVARMAQLHDAGEQGIYARCTTIAEVPASGRGRREHSLAIPGLWADVDLAGPGHAAVNLPPDLDAAKEIIRRASLPQPTLWIHSGGGLYPWWLLQDQAAGLDDTVNRDGWAQLSLRWHKALEHGAKVLGYTYETGTHDLARVLRVPGTVNRKAGLERRCEIIESEGSYFTPAELADYAASAFELIPKIVPLPAPVRAMTGAGNTPLDDFEARTDWADILEPNGWAYVRTEGYSRLWRHPSATADVSASTGHDQGRDRLFMFSTSIPGLAAQEPHTKQYVWAYYNTGGNMSKAASELYKAGYGDRHEPSVNIFDGVPMAPKTRQEAIDRLPASMLRADEFDAGPEASPVERPDVNYKIRARSWDDTGNAYRFADRYGSRVRWIEQAGTWAIYEGGRWALDRAAKMRSLVVKFVDALWDEEESFYSDEPGEGSQGRATESQKDKFQKFVTKTRSAAGQRAMLSVLAGLVLEDGAVLGAEMTDFDQHEWLLNCRNVVVDLRTGETLAHDPKLMMMQQTAVDYVPGALSPKWGKFLGRVMPAADMRTYLQQITGYSMTGSIREQAMFMHVGSGANGKSVYLDVMSKIGADLCQVVPRQTLLAKASDSHPTDIARMIGKRFLQMSETAPGRRLDEEVVKSLTGGENVTARFMGKDYFDFKPSGKIHYVTNHLPHVSSAHSIWRRMHLLKWDVTIPFEEQDPDLAHDIIRDEAEGVLAWVVAGAVEWYAAKRLRRPEDAQTDMEEYRVSEDDLGQFIEDTFETTGDSDDKTANDVIYAQYQHWTMSSGIKAMSKQSLARALTERGWKKFRTNSERGFSGVRLKPGTNRWAGAIGTHGVAYEYGG